MRTKFICLLLSLLLGYQHLSAQNLIPVPKEIKYLSDKVVRIKSIDSKIIPSDGSPKEQYTLKTKGGRAVIIAQSEQAAVWGAAT